MKSLAPPLAVALALALALAACGSKAASTTTPSNSGTAANVAGAAEAKPSEPMSGPFAALADAPAPDELPPFHLVATADAPGAPFLAAQLIGYGELSDALMTMCAMAVQLADGWYVGKPFLCAMQDTRTMTTTTILAIAARDDAFTVRYREDFHGSNMDNEPGESESHDEYVITCAANGTTAGKPACTPPVAAID